MKFLNIIILFFIFASCSPTIKVEAPDKPMEINLNVKIDHQISIKVDKELDGLIKKNDDIF